MNYIFPFLKTEHCMQELPNIKSRSQFRAPVKSQNKTVGEIVIGHAEGNILSGTCFHVLFLSIFIEGN